ncbi:hypothetical protein JVT61DRAFT_12156 [Boletus reticuloceps]|uniref:Uncharacterized protein n=1 Tax=Boletus reticuloceps TaxID=495285 RepID=A0A8I2YEN1_9AGAM|nr:hypothetical protein JVT61DRAFT_12156 [Boletus reticuloceps]
MGVLHKHLHSWHLLQYITVARERSWMPHLLVVARAIDNGYTLLELETFVRNGVDIANLSPKATPGCKKLGCLDLD